MRWGIFELGANPMTLVRVSGVSRRQTEPRILTADEIRALISRLPTDPYRVMVVMALSTGLRCSELFALKWMDCDWHADIRTTMNVYTQAVSEQKRAAHSKVVQMVLSAWRTRK